jgi:phage host-nuclease inhibitor protein Gam
MPRQRWRNEVLQELRGSRADIRALSGVLHEDSAENRRAIERLGEQSRSAVRDMKASVDRNTEVTDRVAEVLSGLKAEVRSSMTEIGADVRAQTSAILTLIDELRSRN